MRFSGASGLRFPGSRASAARSKATTNSSCATTHWRWGLIQAGEADFAAFGLVHHPDNHHVVGPWEHYRSLVADASPLFRIPANLLIDVAADQGAPWSAWACYMRERYMLATTGTSE